MVEPLPDGLFGRQVTSRAERLLRRRRPASHELTSNLTAAGPGRQPKIQQLGVLGRRQHDGVGGDVAVDEHLGMAVGERIRQFDSKVDRPPHVEGASSHGSAYWLAHDPLDGQEEPTLVFADFEQRRNVGMGQRTQGAGLPKELPTKTSSRRPAPAGSP